MRKIYTITIEDDLPLPSINSGVVKALAYLLYTDFCKFDKPILCANENEHDNLIINELFEKTKDGKYVYKFKSDDDIDNYYKYDPFMINNVSFGITTFDNAISDSEVDILMQSVLKLSGYSFKYKIDSVTYDETNKKARHNVIDSLINKRNISNVKTKIRLPILNLIK